MAGSHALAQTVPCEPRMRRWDEQRWVLDNLIQTNGIDWDQGSTGVILRACGLAVQADMVATNSTFKRPCQPPRAAACGWPASRRCAAGHHRPWIGWPPRPDSTR
ncbi:MAG: hypothetical protein NTW37_21795 [Proteobacteria bacterium]|nr:hypothetical protein [Pseudomonadota bacterium]